MQNILSPTRLILVVSAMATIFLSALLGSSTALGQGDPAPQRPIDLAIEFPYDSHRDIEGVITNHSSMEVNDVRVRIDIDRGLGTVEFPDGASFTGGVLTIPAIAPGAEARFTIEPYNISDTSRPSRIFLTRASIESSSPKESPGLEYNNRAEIWTYFLVEAVADFADVAGTSMATRVSVDDLRPDLNGQTAFTVAAINLRQDAPFGFHYHKYDVQIRITLSQSMRFASSSMPSTTISGNTATWRVGDLPATADATRTKTLSVPVNLNGSAPLETRCITAELVQVLPPDPEDKKYDDAATVCLGDEPLELIADGEIGIFKYVPCIGVTAYPCNTDDTLEIVTEVVLGNPELAPKQRRNDPTIPPNIGNPGVMYLQPESALIQVKDPQGRHEGKWRTGTTSAHSSHYRRLHGISGVELLMDLIPSGYRQYTYAVSDMEPKQRAGTLTLLGGATAAFTLLDADTKTSSGPFDLGQSTTSKPYAIVAEFSTLGLHKVQLTFGASTSGTAYTDMVTYAFYVGPIAELEVRQGARPPGRQKGYVIEAVNHGPDAAAGVLVTLTGVPEGAQAEPSRGRYEKGSCDENGLCEGFWTIDEMNALERARVIGESEKETLIIFGDGAPITAAIKSTEDYSVVIDGTRHSTEYYDHIGDNNEAQITSQPGTGRGDPNAPQELKVQKFGDLALLQWEAPENKLVNGWPVTHYQVERNGVLLPDEVPGTIHADVRGGAVNQAYRVRAVNYLGGHTPWSLPAGASGPLEQPGTQGLGAPNGLTATPGAGDARRIDLSWFAPSADNILRYIIEHATDGAGPWTTLAHGYSRTTYSHTGAILLPGTTHYYRVATVKGNDISAWAYAQATTEIVDGAAFHVPGWPENLRFTSISRTAVTLAWDPPHDDGGSRVTGYEYRVFGPCASGADAVCDIVAPRRVSGTSVRISGLNREGTYQFEVRALNAVGASDWSQPITKDVGPATAGGGRVTFSPSRLTVAEGGEATYRVKLSRAPTLPLYVVLHPDGDGYDNLAGNLHSQQFKILLPSGYDTSGLTNDWCDGNSIRFDWNEAYAWNVGAPITVVAAEDDDSDHETLTIRHTLYTVPADCLGMTEDEWKADPVYDDMHGIALTVTERDND